MKITFKFWMNDVFDRKKWMAYINGKATFIKIETFHGDLDNIAQWAKDQGMVCIDASGHKEIDWKNFQTFKEAKKAVTKYIKKSEQFNCEYYLSSN